MSEATRPRRRNAKVDYAERPVEDLPPRELKQDKDPKDAKEAREPASVKKRPRERSATKEASPTPEEDDFPLNWQPSKVPPHQVFSNTLNLTGAFVRDSTELVLKNGTTIRKGENIYLVCEPPGEPYYVGRIMGFSKRDGHGDGPMKNKEPAEHCQFKINWWYRSRDISKHSPDSRLLYASMHSDTCPLTSYRGMCLVKHKTEIDDLDEYKTVPNQFWFDRLFDRYMIKFYDVIPTLALAHLPENYLKALHKRFQYIFVEQGKSKEMLQRPKNCVKCNQWCVPSDSIQCCECDDFYHMLCLDPPLLKKPARGFAWSCITCTKKLEHNKMASEFARLGHSKQKMKTSQDQEVSAESSSAGSSVVPSSAGTELQQADVSSATPSHEPIKTLAYEEAAKAFLERDKDLSLEDRRKLEEWSYRYLGMHAKLEDALDLQDSPYPRAASRLGNKHQWTGVTPWCGRPVHYFDYSELNEEYHTPSMFKKPAGKGGRKKKNTTVVEEEIVQTPLKLPQEFQNVDPDEFPPWLQPKPKGYIERGGDNTATLMWKQPEDQSIQDRVSSYIVECAPIAEKLDLLPNTPNFMDAILKNLLDTNFNFEKAMSLNHALSRQTLKEPTFSASEVKKFESGVKKYGSELWPTFKEVKTQPFSMIVRFYYLWKKTTNGRQIWGNYEGRKSKSKGKTDDEDKDIANAADDSSYDTKKSKRSFVCKHCKTEDSTFWFRAPGAQHSEDDPSVVLGLCMRCARLWRRYAVTWEDPDEVLRKVNIKGGASWRKKMEQELITDAEQIVETRKAVLNGEKIAYKKKPKPVKVVEVLESSPAVTPTPKKTATDENSTAKEKKSKKDDLTPQPVDEVVSAMIQDSAHHTLNQQFIDRMYYITSPTHNPRPKFKEFTAKGSALSTSAGEHTLMPTETSSSCGVCREFVNGVNSLTCYGCGMSAHQLCYGLDLSSRGATTWYCDPCSNKLHPVISVDHECVLCREHHDFAAMKRTNGGQWVHVLCMLLVEDSTCLNATSMQPIGGLEKVFADKVVQPRDGAMHCMVCQKSATVAELLSQNTFKVGFEVLPDAKPETRGIKISNSKNGKLQPAIVCVEHENPKTFTRMLDEVKRTRVSGSITALQAFLEDSKRSTTLLSGVQERFRDTMEAFRTLSGLVGQENGSHSSNGDAEFCSSCSTTITLKWYVEGDGRICYGCWSKKQDEDAEMKDADDDSHAYLSLATVVKEKLILDDSLGIRDSHDRALNVPVPDDITDPVPNYRPIASALPDPVLPSEEDQNTDSETTPLLPQLATFGNGTARPRKKQKKPSEHPEMPPMATFTSGNLIPTVHNVLSSSVVADLSEAPKLVPLLNTPSQTNFSHTLQPLLDEEPVVLPPLRKLSEISTGPVALNGVETVDVVKSMEEEKEYDKKEEDKPMNKMSIGSILD